MPLEPRRATTLIELLITLAILAIIASVTTMAARRITPVDHADPRQMIEDSLRRAVADNRAIRMQLDAADAGRRATANADGTVATDSLAGVSRLTGAPTHAR